MYDGLLSAIMPEGVELIGFADYRALVERWSTTEIFEKVVNEGLQIVERRTASKNLKLAVYKMEGRQ